MELSGGRRVCRLCLTLEGSILSVFENAKNSGIGDIIEEFLNLKVCKDERIPWMVCTGCMAKLQDFHDYKKQAVKNFKLLESLNRNDKSSGENLVDAILALKGGAQADGPEGNLPEKQEYDEEESFRLMLESDSDECSDPGIKLELADEVASSETKRTPRRRKRKYSAESCPGVEHSDMDHLILDDVPFSPQEERKKTGQLRKRSKSESVASDVPCVAQGREGLRRRSEWQRISMTLNYSRWFDLRKAPYCSLSFSPSPKVRKERRRKDGDDLYVPTVKVVSNGENRVKTRRSRLTKEQDASMDLSLPDSNEKNNSRRGRRKTTGNNGASEFLLKQGRKSRSFIGRGAKNA
ncbi:uncharacterized protein LOC124172628 [Ischnura elegans]|uniref:uncharacterized protein LOC124172628 n=1 Tax=Ischnura elegans TaxID=197161 RepID=UPI001ED8BF08|nr:uncharacterized protein LOC124172628 [Ischnura elegans]